MSLIDLGPYEAVDMTDWRWPNFTPFELRHRLDDRVWVVPEFMDRIQDLRERVGFALPVNSYFRSPKYNDAVSSTGLTGPHVSGRAVDLGVAGQNAFTLLHAAIQLGFTGIGVKQKGPWAGRFLHLDTLEDGGHPRPRIWSY